MTVLQVCAFAAPNAGNFIASLTNLEERLAEKGIQTIYAFADGAKDKAWCQEIQKRTKVYFLPTAKARILPQTYRIMWRVYRENAINIVHSHFELYDIPVTVTAPKNTKIFWHLHDPIVLGRGLRRMLWRFQYGVVGKRANLISVCDYYRNVVIEMGFPVRQTVTILNGIDVKRIRDCRAETKKNYDFLTFGWDFYRKGDDLILNVCSRLSEEGYLFRLLFNGNEQTWSKLDEYLSGSQPPWLVCCESVSDVNELYAESKVFIQASRRETFSYAVCEASYAGLPVISSDIAGLEWAHELPSVSFFETENEDQLYRLMKGHLDETKCLKTEIENSQRLIYEHYSLNAWTNRIMKCYQLG